MDKQKRFKKQELNSEDYKGMERGAKFLKGSVSLGALTVVLIKNKDKLKTIGDGIVRVVLKK